MPPFHSILQNVEHDPPEIECSPCLYQMKIGFAEMFRGCYFRKWDESVVISFFEKKKDVKWLTIEMQSWDIGVWMGTAEN